MVIFTSDIDWAPEEVIEEMLQLFESFNIKCTLFNTHYSETINSASKKLFEIAIHPNFNPLLDGKGGSVDQILDDLLDLHPNSKGVRSHSMTQNSYLLQKFTDKGLLYDANHFLPYHTNISPFKLWTGMVRIPYNWEDDVHWLYGKSFEDCGLDFFNSPLTIFDFHPIHVFLNTEKQERYENAKKFYKDPKALKEYRNNSNITNIKGTRDLLIELLKATKTNNLPNCKMIDLAAK